MNAASAAAAVLLLLTATTTAAADDASPRAELPLGPFVRPGRPVDVRVPGADRVRLPGGAWALPQGERGDEFVLQATEAVAGALVLEVERGGAVDHVTVPADVLPAGGAVVGQMGDAETKQPASRVVRLRRQDLPTVAEGWLLLDDVVGTGVPPQVTSRLELLRRVPIAARGLFDPSALPPDARPFAAAAEAAALGPRLPAEVGAAFALLGAAECVLAVVLALRRDSPWRRAAWLSVPAAVAAAFLLVCDPLPGPLRADAVAVTTGQDGETFVLVRVEARRAGRASFEVPAGASSAVVLRFAADDATIASVSAGRRVEVDLPAGQSRVFAYVLTPGAGEAGGLSDTLREAAPVPPALAAWLGSMGAPAGAEGSYGFPAGLLPRARGTAVVAGFRAAAHPAPMK